MGILAQCPICNTKQSTRNKVCRKCAENLDKAKKARKVKYWINYRFPGGKQRREFSGYSISEAQDALGKKMGQKREGRLFDIRDDAKLTFSELTEWYLNLKTIRNKAYFKTLTYNLNSFNEILGNTIIAKITKNDLQEYQTTRKEQGYSESYIDQHIAAARAMLNHAYDNDKIGPDVLMVFKKVKKLLGKKAANARDRILTHDEFTRICENSARHIREIVTMGYFTGMRKGEILNLTWDKVDMKNRFIHLEAEDTKDKEKRSIPICDELHKMLTNIPRHLHDKHVFLFRGKPVSDIRRGLVSACGKSGILYGRNKKNGFTFHDLRHTFNTNMRKAGVPESVIMDITGHSTREMFDRYNTVDLKDSQQAVDQMEVFLQSVDQNVDQNKKGT